MAKVKIVLEPDENLQEVEGDLLKAFNYQNSGEIHSSESFDDPAMTDLNHRLDQNHKKIYTDMLNEIFETLDEDYT